MSNDPFLFASRRWGSGSPPRPSDKEVERYCKEQRDAQEAVNRKTWGMGCND